MILVVDDDSACLGLLVDILTSEGYNVTSADTGEQALASIAARSPELILLDIRMPSMDGFEVCRRMKARRATREIPIVFLSEAGKVEERAEGLRRYAADLYRAHHRGSRVGPGALCSALGRPLPHVGGKLAPALGRAYRVL